MIGDNAMPKRKRGRPRRVQEPEIESIDEEPRNKPEEPAGDIEAKRHPPGAIGRQFGIKCRYCGTIGLVHVLLKWYVDGRSTARRRILCDACGRKDITEETHIEK